MLSKEKVEAVLFKMGMPANVKGFGYIVDSVLCPLRYFYRLASEMTRLF